MAFWEINRIFGRNKVPVYKTKTPVGGKVTGGASALTIALILLIGPWEGDKLKPYLDDGGLATACRGVTGPEITAAYKSGRIFTDEECGKLNEKALNEHWKSLKRLVTYKPLPIYTEAALISFHYNVGSGQFASSTLLRKLNAGDIEGACNELPRWTKIKGKNSRGLENRRWRGDAERISERTLCMIGIDPSYKTPLFDKLVMKIKGAR